MGSYRDPATAVRRGCTNKEMRKVTLAALATGARSKLTKNGIMIFNEDGDTAVTHFTSSDRAAALNFQKRLQRIGVLTKGTP